MSAADRTGEPPRKQLKMSTPPNPAPSSSSGASAHPFSALAHSPNGSRISLDSALKTRNTGPSYGMEGAKASSSSGFMGGKAPKKLILKSSRRECIDRPFIRQPHYITSDSSYTFSSSQWLYGNAGLCQCIFTNSCPSCPSNSLHPAGADAGVVTGSILSLRGPRRVWECLGSNGKDNFADPVRPHQD